MGRRIRMICAPLRTAFEQGYDLVLGSRTQRLRNWRTMTLRHLVANAALGLWCGVLCGRPFSDLGPLRMISRRLFEKIAPQEMTFGWTIEAQIAAARLRAAICEIPRTSGGESAASKRFPALPGSARFRSAARSSPLVIAPDEFSGLRSRRGGRPRTPREQPVTPG